MCLKLFKRDTGWAWKQYDLNQLCPKSRKGRWIPCQLVSVTLRCLRKGRPLCAVCTHTRFNLLHKYFSIKLVQSQVSIWAMWLGNVPLLSWGSPILECFSHRRGPTADESSLCTVSDSYKIPCKVQFTSNNVHVNFLLNVVIQQSIMHCNWCIP